MFILYALVVGLLLGVVTGGSPARLAALRFRWGPAVAAGLLTQVVLFSTPAGDALGGLAPWVYIASNVLVLAAVARNVAIRGLALVFAGGLSNALAILVNDGYMPVSAAAMAAMGRVERAGYSNSRFLEDVQLAPLTDIFAMPTWLPGANVFSVGDMLIGIGAAAAIGFALHRRDLDPPVAARPTPFVDGAPRPDGASAH